MINSSYFSSYYNSSNTFFYSLIFISPLFIIYELMCWFQFKNEPILIRNGADVFFKNLINPLSILNNKNLSILLIIFFILIIFMKKYLIANYFLNLSFLFFMVIESIFWSLILTFILTISNYIMLSSVTSELIIEKFYLAIGAGIWEELLFRVFMIFIFTYIFKNILSYSIFYSSLISLLISSLLFSLFHYIGPYGDIFTYSSLYLRSIAGIFLGMLYLARGYGITVYAHVLYDFFIISIPILINKNLEV